MRSALKLSLALAAVSLLALAACADDQPPPPPHGAPGGFGEGHGGPPHRPSLFISPNGEPFRAPPGAPYPVAAWFAQADRNHDGRIDRAEFRADAEAFFHKLDQNEDGVVDSFEVQTYEREMVPEITGAYAGGDLGGGDGSGHHGGRRGGGQGGGASLEGATPYELLPTPEPVASADAQLDGRITLQEFLDNADRNFDLLDKAGRGYLTLDSLPKTPLQTQIERAGRQHPPQGGDAH